ncbi:MAG: hypothetical protein DWI28_00180 [Planctomycetota bacterium]|nr:MAG: hypothetical protein DWI28_00180 [Planctomycetota bacterium]
MSSERSLEIECRLDDVFRLIRTGRFSTPMLAEEVSIPTISRCVTALRLRGHDINAVKTTRGWRFVLANKPSARPKPNGGTRATVEQSGAPKG